MRALVYAHPIAMVAGIALAALAFRAGTRLRRARLARGRKTPAMRAAHLRLAKPAVVLILLGFVGGPISAVWLRGFEAFDTFHSAAGIAAATLFTAAAVVGRRIEKGRSRAYEVHARLAALALLAAALAAVAGFVLLP